MKRNQKSDSTLASKPGPKDDSAPARKRARALLRELSKPGKAEGQHIELKRDLMFAPPARRAEFVRDVLSLANSEGEHPRERAYLVIGLKDGNFVDTSRLNLDGATIGQIIDTHVVPRLKYNHCSFFIRKDVRTDVIEFEPDSNILYMTRREFRDENQRMLLSPGQTWGRRADSKRQLTGDEIFERLQQIQTRLCELAASPLRERLSELEQRFASAGPENDVRRILYQMEQCQQNKDWEGLRSQCYALSPYLRDFRKTISKLVLDNFGPFVDVRDGTPVETVDAILNTIFSCLPAYSFRHKSHNKISQDDANLYLRAAELTWDIAYDAIKYANNLGAVEKSCDSLADIGKVAHLNELADLIASVADHFDSLKKLCDRRSTNERFLALVSYFEAEAKLQEPKRPDFMQ